MHLCKSILAGGILAAGWASPPAIAETAETDASTPQAVEIALYDEGFGLVSELRRLTLARGLNRVHFVDLPVGLDPSSVSFIPVTGASGLQVLEQRYAYDVATPRTLLERMKGESIDVLVKGQRHEGTLMHVGNWGDGPAGEGFLIIDDAEAGAWVVLQQSDVDQVILPHSEGHVRFVPTLEWRAETGVEGPQNIRLTYRVDDLSWKASYDVVLDEAGRAAYFGGRIGLHNQSGASYSNAQIQLVATERGLLRDEQRAVGREGTQRTGVEEAGGSALRYAYGAREPAFEEALAGPVPLEAYTLPQPIDLRSGDQVFVQYVRTDQLPVERFYVYDGVRFDRFRRHRRNDWNYGTESHSVVETHLQFNNVGAEGLGLPLPPGRFRLYQKKNDGTVEFIGEDRLLPTQADEKGHVRLGAARGLQGDRERTGYTEITPLRVYEESFQITVENNTEETVTVRVVEHLYRWHDYEIVRADAEYEEADEQTIEFRPELRPGGRRTINYTVRYSW